MEYKKTLNLPQTDFSMRANSVKREPELQAFWKSEQIYEKNLQQRKNGHFILHDGPPYLSSGKIHIGHALNRVLKDIVVKYKTLKGHACPLIFGYDCHGLPIEHEVSKKKKNRADDTPLEIRQACKAFALESLQGQSDNFYRLGLMGNWEAPYLTMDPEYEAAQLKVFAKMVGKNYIYKGLKPIYWCVDCKTALAEAEVEYQDHQSHSIYVKMPLLASEYAKLPGSLANKNIYFVIWTTTPWTLPANLAIALNPEFDYDFIELENNEVWVLAHDRVEAVSQATGLSSQQVIHQAKGKELEGLHYQHPFYERSGPIVLGNHVTTEAGTGCVHTAPGHGMEDYEVGDKYGLGILSPVDRDGKFTDEAPGFEGEFYQNANQKVIDLLQSKEKLVKHTTFKHSYPHCWRSKTALIYRATKQWFASVEGFRQDTLDAVDKVQWIPTSGHDRISNMIADRSDWCVSRQRVWGVPIPAFECLDCHHVLLTQQLTEHVAEIVAEHGSDIWWQRDAKALMPDHFACPECQGTSFEKDSNIMDVWFDSGTSHSGVLRQRPELSAPADLYLEGSDQHRGWFQSSLLTSIAAYQEAPYKTVLTHGFALDGEGKKMSKSVGNVVEPSKVIQQYGADVLRLWVASVDYTSDVKVSYDILGQMADIYRKIRNTIRFLISNLYDFDPQQDALAYTDLSELDRFTLHQLNQVTQQMTDSFERFAFYRFYQLLQNFCVVDLSNVYFAIVKDILYIEASDSKLRRSVQTVLWEVLQSLLGMITPVLTHMAEDARENLPPALQSQLTESVLLGDFPEYKPEWQDQHLADQWTEIMSIRDELNLLLEAARAQKKIGRSMEANASLHHSQAELQNYIQTHQELFRQVFIVADLDFSNQAPEGELSKQTENFAIAITPAAGNKCARCWKTSPEVGENTVQPDLCLRCDEIVQELIKIEQISEA